MPEFDLSVEGVLPGNGRLDKGGINKNEYRGDLPGDNSILSDRGREEVQAYKAATANPKERSPWTAQLSSA